MPRKAKKQEDRRVRRLSFLLTEEQTQRLLNIASERGTALMPSEIALAFVDMFLEDGISVLEADDDRVDEIIGSWCLHKTEREFEEKHRASGMSSTDKKEKDKLI